MEIPNHFPILNSSKKITDLGARRNPQLLIFNSYFLFFSAFFLFNLIITFSTLKSVSAMSRRNI